MSAPPRRGLGWLPVSTSSAWRMPARAWPRGSASSPSTRTPASCPAPPDPLSPSYADRDQGAPARPIRRLHRWCERVVSGARHAAIRPCACIRNAVYFAWDLEEGRVRRASEDKASCSDFHRVRQRPAGWVCPSSGESRAQRPLPSSHAPTIGRSRSPVVRSGACSAPYPGRGCSLQVGRLVATGKGVEACRAFWSE